MTDTQKTAKDLTAADYIAYFRALIGDSASARHRLFYEDVVAALEGKKPLDKLSRVALRETMALCGRNVAILTGSKALPPVSALSDDIRRKSKEETETLCGYWTTQAAFYDKLRAVLEQMGMWQ